MNRSQQRNNKCLSFIIYFLVEEKIKVSNLTDFISWLQSVLHKYKYKAYSSSANRLCQTGPGKFFQYRSDTTQIHTYLYFHLYNLTRPDSFDLIFIYIYLYDVLHTMKTILYECMYSSKLKWKMFSFKCFYACFSEKPKARNECISEL